LIWSTREVEVALMFAGQLACEAANFVLKRLLKQERPSRIHRTGKGYGMPSSHAQFVAFWAVAMTLFLLVRHTPSWTDHGYGPRSAATAATAVVDDGNRQGGRRGGGVQPGNRQAGDNTTRPARRTSSWGQEWVMVETYAHRPWSYAERAAAAVFVLGVAALVAWSRVYLGYHTVNQVLVGCLAGSVCAVAWYAATAAARSTGLLAWALESPFARGLRVRDLVVSEDLCQAGWEKWEDRKGGSSGSVSVAPLGTPSSRKKK
jgi:dolichyldiphosphatase